MKIGVFFEFAALTSGFGMLVGGFFGMNTISGLEETRLAWGVIVLLTILFMALIMGCFMRVLSFIISVFHYIFIQSFYHLKADTSTAQKFNLLKNFFTYFDDLEQHLGRKNVG